MDTSIDLVIKIGEALDNLVFLEEHFAIEFEFLFEERVTGNFHRRLIGSDKEVVSFFPNDSYSKHELD